MIFTFCGSLIGLYFMDHLSCVINNWLEADIKSANSRWFLLHSVSNAVITTLTTQDLVDCITTNNYDGWSSLTGHAISVAVALHVYHIIAFWDNMKNSDWLHHGLMCGIGAPLSIISPTKVTGASLWFLSGFPGMIDYFLLWLVKIGKIDYMTEKHIYAQLTIWLRAPGCMLCSVLMLPQIKYNPLGLVAFLNTCLAFWNGQYYTMLTLRDYGKHIEKRRKISVI